MPCTVSYKITPNTSNSIREIIWRVSVAIYNILTTIPKRPFHFEAKTKFAVFSNVTSYEF